MIKLLKKLIEEILRPMALYIVRRFVSFNDRIDLPGVEEAYALLEMESANPGNKSLWDHCIIEEDNTDLTIIVPVYNVLVYLDACMYSLLNQKTKYKYIVVAIDDGSTDGSGERLDAYAYDARLMILHQENSGVAVARNVGLRNAHSKYVMFVDSDDLLNDGAVEALLNEAYRLDADVVEGGYYEIDDYDGTRLEVHTDCFCDHVPPNGVYYGMPWGKVYKTKLFNKICFPEGYWYEDTIVTGLLTHIARVRAKIPEIIYSYRKRITSTTSISAYKPKCLDTLWVNLCVLDARKQLGLKTDVNFFEHMLRQIILNYKRTINEPEAVKKSLFVMTRKMLLELNEEGPFRISEDHRCLEAAILNKDYRKYCLLCRLS